MSHNTLSLTLLYAQYQKKIVSHNTTKKYVNFYLCYRVSYVGWCSYVTTWKKNICFD
jgi:hypothetical protein